MYYRLFQILIFIILTSACQTKKTSPRTILVVVAHPDDETTISPVLAKYAATDSVYLIIATDGQFEVTGHAGIPSGDSLVAIRNEEAKCSCAKMGIHEPIRLGL